MAAGIPIGSNVRAEPIAVAKEFPKDHYALKVYGQSMEPTIEDGAIIVVKRWGTDKGFPRKGTIVVYSDETGSTLKVFDYRKAGADEEADTMGNVPALRSLNKSFADVQTLESGRIDAVYVETL